MTYNIRLDIDSDGENKWSKRSSFLSSQIHFYEPDILGVQEATPNQMVDLSNALTAYDFVGIGREGIGKGEASSIFFKKDRFELIVQNTFWLSSTPENVSIGWDAACHRICTCALFKDRETKHQFWVFNTHLDHIGEVARDKAIDLILSKIEDLNSKQFPVFFMGDFNSEPTDQRIINLSKQMIDSRTVSMQPPFGSYGTFNGFKPNENLNKRIDYIFISNKCKVLKYGTLTDSVDLRYPSDHFPVLIDVIIE